MISWVVKLTANLLRGHWFPAHQRPSFHQNTYISSCSTSFFSLQLNSSHLCGARPLRGTNMPNKWAKQQHVVTLFVQMFRRLWKTTQPRVCVSEQVQHVRPKSTSTSITAQIKRFTEIKPASMLLQNCLSDARIPIHTSELGRTTVWHSRPLHAVIGQLCGGENFSLSFFPPRLIHGYFCHFSCKQQYCISLCLWWMFPTTILRPEVAQICSFSSFCVTNVPKTSTYSRQAAWKPVTILRRFAF